jgi:nitroreductase
MRGCRVEVLQAIRSRRSIRRFTEKRVARETIDTLLDAARWAPNGGNRQLWRFIVVTEEGTRDLIRKCSPGIFVGPPVYVVICYDELPAPTLGVERDAMADCAIAAQDIMLAAHSLGLGSCAILSYSPTAVQQILGLPENVKPKLVVTLGYPAEDPEPPARRPIHEIAFEERYGRQWGR